MVMTGSSDGYRRDTSLEVRRQNDSPRNHDGRGPYDSPRYAMYNASGNSQPYLQFEIPADASVLRAMFDNTTVKDDSTLKAELKRNSRSWLMKLAGELQNCPGTCRLSYMIQYLSKNT